MSATGLTRIEALSKENYDTWKLQMQAVLVKNDAWAYVSGILVRLTRGRRSSRGERHDAVEN